jgi:hypothetical protein
VRCVPTEWLWNGIINQNVKRVENRGVFDLGLNYSCWKPFDKSYGKELINHFDFKFEESGINDSTMAECFAIRR